MQKNKKKNRNLKNLKAHIFSKPFVRHIRPFFHKSETTLSKQFLQTFFVVVFFIRHFVGKALFMNLDW